jgi:hypothetical protein
MTPSPPDDGGPPDHAGGGGGDDEQGGGPPDHVELPEAVPQRIRERILSGRTERRDIGTAPMEGQL